MPLTPSQIESNRAQEAKNRELLRGSLSLSSFNIDSLTNSIPKNLLTQGQAKLPSLYLDQGGKLLQYVVPGLNNILSKLGIQELPKDVENISKDELIQTYCPTSEELDSIIEQRNNLVEYLNNIGTKLDSLSITINFGSTFASLLQGLVNISKTTERIGNQALKFVPGFLQGAANSALNLLGYVQDDALFKNDGTPRIPPLTITASQVSPSVSTVQAIIFQITQELSKLDFIINLCNPFATLTDTSQTIQDTANNELLAEQSENQTSYKGFILEIETRAYTDTVDQNRAVGKNRSGIIMISTEYSFASDPNILIEELKFIIDRDDLKAY